MGDDEAGVPEHAALIDQVWRFGGTLTDRYTMRSLDRFRDGTFPNWPPMVMMSLAAFIVPLNWFLTRKMHIAAIAVLLRYVVAFGSLGARWGFLGVLLIHIAAALFGDWLYLRHLAHAFTRGAPAARVAGLSRTGRWIGRMFFPGSLVWFGLVVGLVWLGATLPKLDRDPSTVGLGFWLGAIAVVLPASLWVAYAFTRSGGRRADSVMWGALGMGVLAAAIAEFGNALGILMLAGFTSIASLQALAIAIIAGTSEEAAKLLVLAGLVLRELPARRRADWPWLGMMVGLGFALTENLEHSGNVSVLAMGVGRAAVAVPFHACLGMIMGRLLTRARQRIHYRPAGLLLAWAVPAVLHACYDYAPILDDLTTMDPLLIGLTVLTALAEAAIVIGIIRQLSPWPRSERQSLALGLALLALAPATIVAFALAPAAAEDFPGNVEIAIGVLMVSVAPFLLGGEMLLRRRQSVVAAVAAIKAQRRLAGRMSVDEILAARHEGHKY